MVQSRPPVPPPLGAQRPGAHQGAQRGPMPPPGAARRPPPHHQARHLQPKRRRGGFLSALFYLFLLMLIVVGAGTAYLIVNPPSDLIRQTIADQVKAKTGRDLIVSGPAAFSFYPGLGVSLKDVTLSGPPGSAHKLASIGELDVNIKTMPLINRQIEVRRLILRKPVFDLRVDKQGRKNWQFAEAAPLRRYAQAASPEGAANDAAPATDAASGGGPRVPRSLSDIEHLQLDDVRIEDGTLRFTDDRTGKTQQVSAVNVQVALKSLLSPITAKGDLAWQGQKVAFDGKMSNLKTMLEEKPSRLTFAANNANVTTSFDGTVLVKDGADIEGKLNAKSPSARGLAKWFGTELPPVQGFGPMSLAGDVKTNGNVTSISNANFGLDGATATGTVTVKTGGVRPYVQANLRLSELNLNKYMTGAAPIAASGEAADDAPATPAQQPAAKPATKPAAGAAEPADAIENLLKSPPGAKVYGATQRAGWSSDAINLALLGVADTDSKLQIGRLIFQNIKVGQSALTVALKNRVMKTTFDDVQLYDGHGKGFLNVDATGKAAGIGANFALDGISALPFLKDAADIAWLSGKAKVGLQLASTGGSQLQLVEALNGRADFKFADGAIVGFNVPGAVRGISQGKFTGFKQAPSEKTDFSELSATFNIQNGIAQNSDLQLVSPLLRVTGAGAVQLPPRTVDYMVKPKIVASLEGAQSNKALSGIEIPVRISGPWSKLDYQPDFKGVLADPNKAIEAVKEIGKQFKGKNAGEIVNDLLGKKSGDGATGSTSGAQDLLKNLLKKQ